MADVQDEWQSFYRQRLNDLIPGIYWREDEDGVLGALADVIAAEAARMRASHDRSWENQSVELADDWIVSYLADLTGTRLVSTMDARAKRVDVANTIYYRRRAGTPAILDEIVSNVTGWQTTVTEAREHLLRMPHRLDQEVPVATPDLRSRRTAFLAGGPFESSARLPDVRKAPGPEGVDGRMNIDRVLFFAHTTPVYPVFGVDPGEWTRGDGTEVSTFDPSGRPTQLWASERRLDDDEDWRPPNWTSLPAPLTCERLADSVYRVDEQLAAEARGLGVPAGEITNLGEILGASSTTIDGFRRILGLAGSTVSSDPQFEVLRRTGLQPGCGRRELLVGNPHPALSLEDGAGPLDPFDVSPMTLDTTTPDGASKAVDPVSGLFVSDEDVETVDYHYGWPGPVGAGTYARTYDHGDEPTDTRAGGGALTLDSMSADAVVELQDNRTWSVAGTHATDWLRWSSREGQRPFLRLGSDIAFEAANDGAGQLDLLGLWFGADEGEVETVRIDGDFEDVVIDHCTFDPGGGSGAVVVEVVGSVERLVIRRSILGRLVVTGAVQSLRIEESIFYSTDAPAIVTSTGCDTSMLGSTIVGEVELHRLDATDTLLVGDVAITDLQNGCFRYGGALDGARLPRPYRVVRLATDLLGGLFESTAFGSPRFLRISSLAPERLVNGSENGGEIGVWGLLREADRWRSADTKIREYLPIGLVPILLQQT